MSESSYHIAMHPQTLNDFRRAIIEREPWSRADLVRVLGVPVKTDYTLKPAGLVEKWVPPRERFITYEAKDEDWCRYCGIGSIVHEIAIPMEIRTTVPIVAMPEQYRHMMVYVADDDPVSRYPYTSVCDDDRLYAQRAVEWLGSVLQEFYERKKERLKCN